MGFSYIQLFVYKVVCLDFRMCPDFPVQQVPLVYDERNNWNERHTCTQSPLYTANVWNVLEVELFNIYTKVGTAPRPPSTARRPLSALLHQRRLLPTMLMEPLLTLRL